MVLLRHNVHHSVMSSTWGYRRRHVDNLDILSNLGRQIHWYSARYYQIYQMCPLSFELVSIAQILSPHIHVINRTTGPQRDYFPPSFLQYIDEHEDEGHMSTSYNGAMMHMDRFHRYHHQGRQGNSQNMSVFVK
jgi:hypothetical protein